MFYLCFLFVFFQVCVPGSLPMLPSAVGLCLAHSLTGAERASKREEDRKREREILLRRK